MYTVLTPRICQLSLAAPLGSLDHEAHVSTQQSASQAYARVPRSHGDERWKACAQPPPRQGPPEAHSVTTRSLVLVSNAAVRLTLPPARRLRRKSEFDTVHSRGKRIGDRFFGIAAAPNDLNAPRLGMAVGLKATSNSVRRNRVRRLIRESFRLHQTELPALDLVVSARAAARDAGAAELRASLEALWQKVSVRCASS